MAEVCNLNHLGKTVGGACLWLKSLSLKGSLLRENDVIANLNTNRAYEYFHQLFLSLSSLVFDELSDVRLWRAMF